MVEKVKLLNLAITIADGDWIESSDQDDAGIRLIQTGNIGNGIYIDKANRARYISPSTFERLKCTEVFPNDILISRLPDPIGRSCIIPDFVGKAITAVDCTIVRLNDKLCIPKFFVYFSQSESYYSEIVRYTTGTTRKRISRKNLETINIPLYSLEEQQNIVRVLDTISGIIEKRKQQIAKLDELEKSLFIEMFGDPVTNPMGWKVETWENIFTVQTGKLDSNAMVSNGKYPFFTCSKESYRINTYAFDCEALLLAGNNASGDYDVKYYKGKFNAYQRTYVLTIHNPNFTYSFLKRILNFKLSWLKQSSKGTNTKYLTKKILESISIVSPPIDLQILYERKILDIEEKKRFLDESHCIINKLYNATMGMYFMTE